MIFLQDPKIIHQGIDFMVIDYFCNDVISYNKFQYYLDRLQELKEKAQQIDEFGFKFIKDDLDMGMGDFLISSRGTGFFAYYMENQDFRIFISRSKVGSSVPQIRVEIPPKTINRVGIDVAIKLFEILVERLIGSIYTRKVSRIDLATDVWGIYYDPLDLYRFQTKMVQTQFIDDIQIADYVRFHKVQGFQFGKGAKLFRIYDKTKKIQISPNEAYIKYVWEKNGYDESKNYPVFRHEIQYRRDELKQFLPFNIKDEVDYFLRNLPNLWAKALTYVEFVPLNEKELNKIIKNPFIKPDTKRKIYYRAKKDNRRFNLWSFIRSWNNILSTPILKINHFVNTSKEIVKRQLKGLISTFYKVFGADTKKFKEVFYEVNEELEKRDGITLNEYGLIKLADSFIHIYESVIKYGGDIPSNLYNIVVDLYDDFVSLLSSVNNKSYKNILRKVVNYV